MLKGPATIEAEERIPRAEGQLAAPLHGEVVRWAAG
jgi:hypothetical protein